jgi:hypothetical protein
MRPIVKKQLRIGGLDPGACETDPDEIRNERADEYSPRRRIGYAGLDREGGREMCRVHQSAARKAKKLISANTTKGSAINRN